MSDPGHVAFTNTGTPAVKALACIKELCGFRGRFPSKRAFRFRPRMALPRDKGRNE